GDRRNRPRIADGRRRRRGRLTGGQGEPASSRSSGLAGDFVLESLRAQFDGVGAHRGGGFRFQTIHGPDIRDDLPDLIFGDLATPGRHAIGAAFDNCVEDVGGLASIDPFGFYERRTDSATAVRVAAGAVVPAKKTLAFGYVVRVAMRGIFDLRHGFGAARLEVILTRGVTKDDDARGRRAQFALFALARRQRKDAEDCSAE